MDPDLRQDDALTLTRPASLDLGFLELDVLARPRVVLLEAQLLGLGARVLLGHVKEARVGGADELDLDRCRLRHWKNPDAKRKAANAAPSRGANDAADRFCQPSRIRNGGLTNFLEPAANRGGRYGDRSAGACQDPGGLAHRRDPRCGPAYFPARAVRP